MESCVAHTRPIGQIKRHSPSVPRRAATCSAITECILPTDNAANMLHSRHLMRRYVNTYNKRHAYKRLGSWVSCRVVGRHLLVFPRCSNTLHPSSANCPTWAPRGTRGHPGSGDPYNHVARGNIGLPSNAAVRGRVLHDSR